MLEHEAQALFDKFSAPIFRAVKSPTQRKGAESLVRSLWRAFLTDAEIEAYTFSKLETMIGKEEVKVIQVRYYMEMKPSITREELRLLREFYGVEKKQS